MGAFKHELLQVALSAVVLGATALTACDDSNSNTKPTEVTAGKTASTRAGKGGSGDTAKAGKGGSNSAPAKAGSSAEAGKTGSTGEAGKGGSSAAAGTSGDGNCNGDKDCYSCAPTKNEQFLNHCTEAMCSPYDNAKLTKIKDGKLPALP